MRRGISQPLPQTATTPTYKIPTVRTLDAPRIAATPAPLPRPAQSIIVAPNERPAPAVRGVLVDTSGQMIRGLSPATVQAHVAHTQTASEKCKNCGEMRAPAEMKTVVANASNPDNALRLCNRCASVSWKDPYGNDEWKPVLPRVRFDREEGRPYDARARGIGLSDLVNRDTYHREDEVAPQYIQNHVPNAGQWSGAHRVGRIR